ncbi:DUF3072 domain-containing protein [Rhodobacteraceae bacterium CCMM004]|nr:DUF3072 domain-containing protein [Rhodobacteraceae bacterium CCMM004]
MSDHDGKADPAAAAPTPAAGFGAVDTDGNDPMTDEQAVKLRALSEEAGEPFDGALTRAQADERIDLLEEKTGKSVD